MKHVLATVAAAALLFAAGSSQAQENPSCPREKIVVTQTKVENGVVNVQVHSSGYCNVATAIIDTLSVAVNELRHAQAVLDLKTGLAAQGEMHTRLLRIEQPVSPELLKGLSEFHATPACPVDLAPTLNCRLAHDMQAFVKQQ